VSLLNADEELSKYLEEDYERKDKFRKFCRHFGVDIIIPIYQLFSINKISN
jgi:Zn-dependent peptidase ImmA (M78 family)